MADTDYVEQSLGAFLARVAEPTPAPGAGAVAATVVGLAAGLTAMSAGLSRRLPDADDIVSRALGLQEQVRPLAARDAEAYGAVLAALRLPTDDPARPGAVREALSRATDVPLEIATAGAAVDELAGDVVRQGNPNLEGDALTARLLAQAAVRAAVVLVELNLADQPDDPRREQASGLVRALEDVRGSGSATAG